MMLLSDVMQLARFLFQPPRIGGIKVYTENVRRDEVIMDMEILWV